MLKHQKRECVFNLLKTPKCLVRKINLSFQHLYSTGLLVGITTTSSTLGTPPAIIPHLGIEGNLSQTWDTRNPTYTTVHFNGL